MDISEAWLLGYDVPMEREPEQKENDEIVEVVERIKKEAEFRKLVLKVNKLNPAQIEAVKSVVAAFPVE